MRNYKEDFPLLMNTDLAYLDNAATAQRPQAVLDAVQDFYLKSNANPLRGLYDLAVDATDRYEAARERVRRFINAEKTEEIIFTRNTTESINLVAYSWGLTNLKPGDEILITIAEHHSNMLPWQMAARQTGATLKYLDCDPDGSYPLEHIAEAITPQTKFAAIGHVSNVLGCVNPVEEIIARVHANGGLVLVDAAQSTPHLPVDVQALDADFLAFSGHKVYGPMGIGVLYGKEHLLNEMPPFLSGGEMISYVRRDGAVYAELPHKFEAGTVNAADAVGLSAALDYIEEIGWDAILKREEELTKYAFDCMTAVTGVHILGSADYRQHHGILSFTLDQVHPHDIAAILADDHVAVRAGHHCAQPLLTHLGVRSSARVSLAFYNTEEDIDRFSDSLKSIRRKMGLGE
ncbi:MAG: cysteine desulfurase [Lachnospiraceae bacterium]|nr:cysteine desulfurase [Lachnospiraceae bacterium]